MTLPEEIERAALIGWAMYPSVRGPTKAACFKGASGAATCDLNQLTRWAREFPKANWRVVFGPSGLWGLDCDVPPGHSHDGVANFAALVKIRGPVPPRPMLRSGGGGLAVFFRHNGEPIIGESGNPAPGIDPRRGRQSQTIPPSIHHSTGRPYRWITPPWDVAPPTAPAWLLKLLAPPPPPKYTSRFDIDTTDMARQRLFRAVGAISVAPEGSRNNTLNRRAYGLAPLVRQGLLNEQEARQTLYAAARDVGLEHHEIEDTLKSAFRASAYGR